MLTFDTHRLKGSRSAKTGGEATFAAPHGSAARRHAGDCTIYSALINGRPYDGICTCGYGWQCVSAKGDESKMLSEERMRQNEKVSHAG